MTDAQFLQIFQSVIEAFEPLGTKHTKYPRIVLDRIYLKVEDMPLPLFRETCNLIIDTCEHAPKTAKIAEFANIVRARHRSGIREEQLEIVERCDYCKDLQVIQVVATDYSHDTLMLCECADESDPSNWPLPRYDRTMAPLYKRNPVPAEWFKPELLMVKKKIRNKDGTESLVEEMKLESINVKRDEWRAKIKAAAAQWVKMKQESNAT